MSRRIFVLSFCATIAVAQAPNVLELARKAPPEIFADAVIKLVERGEIPPAGQRALLEEAFEAAKHAREPVRLTALPGVRTNTRAALRDAAGGLGLDALSLESRVVKLMTATDAARARELFLSLDHPVLEARPCEDAMIADVSAYYEMAALVAPSDLMLALAPANSPGELASFAKVLSALALGAKPGLAPEDFRLLMGALALKMEMAAPDYRSFTMTADELRAGLEGIAARARELGVPTAALAEGARKLVIAQMSSPRCNEEFGDAMGFVEWFNGRFRGALPTIEREELEPPRALGFLKAEPYFESGEGKQIADDFGRLRMALGTTDWSKMLAQFLRDLSAWRPAGTNLDAFHQKMTVLHGLFQLIPPDEERDALIARAVEFLQSGGIEREYPAEWLLQVRSFAQSAMGDRAKLLTAFRGAGDAGLAVFAVLESMSDAVVKN
jgi:hypothetical protein